MKNILKFIKKHSHLIVGIIIVIFLIIIGIVVKNFFFPDDATAYYGTRLEGIDKVKIPEKEKKALKEALKDRTKSVNIRVAGRLIYVIVVANDDVDVQTAKDFGNNVLGAFSDAEKAYYDIQLLVNNESNKDKFPIIGYKHHTRENMTWTRDR